MHTICPKIFGKLEFLSTISQIDGAYSALKKFYAFVTFYNFALLTQFLKFLRIGRKNTIFVG